MALYRQWAGCCEEGDLTALASPTIGQKTVRSRCVRLLMPRYVGWRHVAVVGTDDHGVEPSRVARGTFREPSHRFGARPAEVIVSRRQNGLLSLPGLAGSLLEKQALHSAGGSAWARVRRSQGYPQRLWITHSICGQVAVAVGLNGSGVSHLTTPYG